jgi:hypothetical protein
MQETNIQKFCSVIILGYTITTQPLGGRYCLLLRSIQAAEIQTTDSIFYHETGHHHCCRATDATALSVVLSLAIKKTTPCSRSFDKPKAYIHKTILLQHHPINHVKQAYTANCNSAHTFYCTVTILLRSKCHMSDIIPMRGHVRYLYKKCLCMKIRLLCKY